MNRLIFFCLLILPCLALKAQAQVPVKYGHNPKAGHFAQINGIRLYYEVYGKGSPLVMLHGNGGSMEAFTQQIPFFSKKYQVIAIDSRLQGQSGGTIDSLNYRMMANDFCNLLDALHLDSVAVLGWSDGGINGLLMALQCPKKVKKLAISGANILQDSTVLAQADIDGMAAVANNPQASAKERLLNKMMLEEPSLPYQVLAAIQCPVLVMAGDHDMIKAEHTLRIYQSIPHAQLCIFPNANHGVCQQYPALFNQTVERFLR